MESGPLTIEFGRMEAAVDPTPLFRGLPDDMCQCHHYGYVISGSVYYKTKDGETEVHAGEAFHILPGHIPIFKEPCEWVAFTRTVEQQQTNEVLAKNAKARAS